eukprot:SM000104S09340  [mRNA]  locus=s104:168292:170325:- [translate_table: standard]
MVLHLGLAISGSGEDLALLGGDGGVAVDEAGEDAAQRLNAEREWRDIQQQQVLNVALEHAALDRGAHRHHLVGESRLNTRHAGHATNQQHLVDVLGREASVLEAGLARLTHTLKQVLGTARVCSDERQVDFCLRRARQLDLGALRRLAQPLQRQPVLRQVDALAALELVHQVLQQRVVKVLTTQEGVPIRCLHLCGPRFGKIRHCVKKRTLGRLFPAVRRDGDDGAAHGPAQEGLRRLLHLGDHEAADLRGRQLAAAGLHPGVAIGAADDFVRHHLHLLLRERVVKLAPNEPLGPKDGVLRVGDGLPLGRRPDQQLALGAERHHRRRRAGALRVLDHPRRLQDRPKRTAKLAVPACAGGRLQLLWPLSPELDSQRMGSQRTARRKRSAAREASSPLRTLSSMTATHELVVPRSMPMMSLPAALLLNMRRGESSSFGQSLRFRQ